LGRDGELVSDVTFTDGLLNEDGAR
jgi:hypothetical protein